MRVLTNKATMQAVCHFLKLLKLAQWKLKVSEANLLRITETYAPQSTQIKLNLYRSET